MAVWLVAEHRLFDSECYRIGPRDFVTAAVYVLFGLIIITGFEEVLLLVSAYPIQLLTIHIQSEVVENGDF